MSKYDAIDFIFSHTARNEKYITMFEYNAKYELQFLHTLNSHLVNRSSSTISTPTINEFNELIFPTGVDIIHQIIQHEFPKLGLIVARQFNEIELKHINSRMSHIVVSLNTHNKHITQSQFEPEQTHCLSQSRNISRIVLHIQRHTNAETKFTPPPEQIWKIRLEILLLCCSFSTNIKKTNFECLTLYRIRPTYIHHNQHFFYHFFLSSSLIHKSFKKTFYNRFHLKCQ